jgi:tetratricopeptide (TPR) repeat protein
VIKFCDQSLILRPSCFKALLRRGMANIHLGEYEKAILDIEKSIQFSESEADRGRAKIFLSKAENGLIQQGKALERRKRALQNVFKPKTDLKPPKKQTIWDYFRFKHFIVALALFVCVIFLTFRFTPPKKANALL